MAKNLSLKKSDKKKIELKENLKQQNKNISIAQINKIMNLKIQSQLQIGDTD